MAGLSHGPTVLHVGYLPATVEEVFFPHAELVGDVGPRLALLADQLEGRLPNAAALLPLHAGILAHFDESPENTWSQICPSSRREGWPKNLSRSRPPAHLAIRSRRLIQ
jgi:hypothetical protein